MYQDDDSGAGIIRMGKKMTLRRMLPFLFLNIIVSATVVLLILSWWDSRQEVEATIAAATEIAATAPVATLTAEVILQVTDTPVASDEPVVYIVQNNDTLGSISTDFDVPIEDIMAANDLTSDLIFVGQALVIPIGGIPTPTPEPTSTAVPATPNVPPSPIPTEPLSTGEVRIQISEVIGLGQLPEEAVSIANLGNRAVALQGWTLSDPAGRVFTFGQVTLFGDGAAILVHTETGQNDASNLYWGLEQAIWSSGTLVTLKNTEGVIQAQYTVP